MSAESVFKLERGKAMAETTKKNKEPAPAANDTVKVETGVIEGGEIEGFTPEEVSRMLKVKGEIASGHYTDITDEHKKLLFVQWMIEHGKLAS